MSARDLALSERAAELDSLERAKIDQAHPWALERYDVYRRRGMSIEAALKAAIAWGNNTTQARLRSYAHETGATP